MKKTLIPFILLCFFVTGILGPYPLYAQDFRLPAPGVMVHLSPPFDPPILKGIKVHPDNPFRFDFILDRGDSQSGNAQLRDESTKLIKYFLASLTIPEKDLWVNLSPYEKNRIIPRSFGLTAMGRDLLAEDYMLKQVTASLIYPEDAIGKKFWKRIYEEAEKRFGTTNIPVSTFNKVWILPEKAVVYENAKAGTAYVVKSKLKVMLEQDYLSLENHPATLSSRLKPSGVNSVNALGSQVVREIVIPELAKEVNEGKNFAQLRQVYNSLILATWYKKKIKDSILSEVYSGKNKVLGISIDDPQEKEKIYQRYLQAFKKGVYNYIKEESDSMTGQPVVRKYFSGGAFLGHIVVEKAGGAMIDFLEQRKEYVEKVSIDAAMESPTEGLERMNRVRGFMDESQAKIFNDLSTYDEIVKTISHSLEINSRWQFVNLMLRLCRFDQEKIEILDNFIKSYVFSHPEELTVEGLEHIIGSFENISDAFGKRTGAFRNPKELIKYFLYYLTVSKNALPEVKEAAEQYIQENKLFELHQTIKEHIKSGKKKILIVHNLDKEAKGDELIKEVTLVQSFLDYNPDIEVTLLINYPFFYDHPRVHVVSVLDEKQDEQRIKALQDTYDLVIDHFRKGSPSLQYSKRRAFEEKFRESGVANRAFIYIKSDEGLDNYVFKNVIVGKKEYAVDLELDYMKGHNVYETYFRLIAELGLPLRTGEDLRPLINGVHYLPAEEKWKELMHAVGNESKNGIFKYPVVSVSPYGGESASKGYIYSNEDDQKKLKGLIKEFVGRGFKVVILPNGKPGGTQDVANQLRDSLPLEVQKNCVVSPEPGHDSRMYKYFVGYSNYVLTVEGGMMHLAYNMGKPFGVIIKPGAGQVRWMPYGRSEHQQIFQDEDEFYLRANLPQQPSNGAMTALDSGMTNAAVFSYLYFSDPQTAQLSVMYSKFFSLFDGPNGGYTKFYAPRIRARHLGKKQSIVVIDKRYKSIVINADRFEGSAKDHDLIVMALVQADAMRRTGYYYWLDYRIASGPAVEKMNVLLRDVLLRKNAKKYQMLAKYQRDLSDSKNNTILKDSVISTYEKIPVLDLPDLSAPEESREDKINVFRNFVNTSWHKGKSSLKEHMLFSEMVFNTFENEIIAKLEELKRQYMPDFQGSVWEILYSGRYESITGTPFILAAQEFFGEIIDDQRSRMFRYGDFYRWVNEEFLAHEAAKILDHWVPGSAINHWNIAVVGAAYGQEPITMAIMADRVIQKELGKRPGIPSDAIKVQVHVLSPPNKVLDKLKANQVIYSLPDIAQYVRSGEITPEEFDKFFTILPSGGLIRSDYLNDRLVFHKVKLGDASTYTHNIPSFNVLVLQNVLQYVNPARHKKAEEDFPALMNETYAWLVSIVRPGGVIAYSNDKDWKHPEVEKMIKRFSESRNFTQMLASPEAIVFRKALQDHVQSVNPSRISPLAAGVDGKIAVKVKALFEMKRNKKKITMLTVYDQKDMRLVEEGGVDISFVGDSYGMTRLGFPDTTHVTMEHMIEAITAAKEAHQRTLLVGDMPFRSYETDTEAISNARRLLAAGAEVVKLEGGTEIESVVRALVQAGIPVMGHIGFTPQTKQQHKIEGRTFAEAQKLLNDALALQRAGAFAVVLELTDQKVAGWITQRISIPTIGIGAGPLTDGQVLVIDDLLGRTNFKDAQRYLKGKPKMIGTWGASSEINIVREFVQKVEGRLFPDKESSFNKYEGPALPEQVREDHAQSALGGIDLTSDKALEINSDGGEGIKFKIDPAMLRQLQKATGFVPVIIDMRPLVNLRTFLGVQTR